MFLTHSISHLTSETIFLTVSQAVSYTTHNVYQIINEMTIIYLTLSKIMHVIVIIRVKIFQHTSLYPGASWLVHAPMNAHYLEHTHDIPNESR